MRTAPRATRHHDKPVTDTRDHRREPWTCGKSIPSVTRDFYARPTLVVTRELIGKLLVHETPAGITSGVIVETEAYIGESDPACHAAPGPTSRNAPLYGPPGLAYVYLNYGIHYLVNAVTEPEGWPAAVLIRALEPFQGEAVMRRRRARGTGKPADSYDTASLCRGPGNLTRALGISRRQNLHDLTASELRIEDAGLPERKLAWSSRIGITVGVDREWRCYAADSDAVSGRRLTAAPDETVPARSARERFRVVRRG
jgi:DNA-3-methyladenine glycosylase